MSEAKLTHVDESGAARMVDVSEKAVTTRVATAAGRVLVSPEVVEYPDLRQITAQGRHDSQTGEQLWLVHDLPEG